MCPLVHTGVVSISNQVHGKPESGPSVPRPFGSKARGVERLTGCIHWVLLPSVKQTSSPKADPPAQISAPDDGNCRRHPTPVQRYLIKAQSSSLELWRSRKLSTGLRSCCCKSALETPESLTKA